MCGQDREEQAEPQPAGNLCGLGANEEVALRFGVHLRGSLVLAQCLGGGTPRGVARIDWAAGWSAVSPLWLRIVRRSAVPWKFSSSHPLFGKKLSAKSLLGGGVLE
jgi:hypothetical protein